MKRASWRQHLLRNTAAIGMLAAAIAPAAASPVPADQASTATPIKHIVVIYGENVSFDHYFATYPNAANPHGEPEFNAWPVPAVNTLATAGLLDNNPNLDPRNGTGASLPFRLDRTQAATADQNHAYTAEQQAYDAGKMDLFPRYTGRGSPGGAGSFGTNGQVMGYYDGNTVTALWHYAQLYAMSDNAYTDTFGPSTPGALEIASGQNNGMKLVHSSKSSYYVPDSAGGLTMINDVDPAGDVCSSTTDAVYMSGQNIGDLLNGHHISWGGFMGGFDLTATNGNGTTGCKRSTLSNVVGGTITDYIPHHNWFQYYPSTANPSHARPSSIAAIGSSVEADGRTTEPANHEYDLNDFYAALQAGNFPSVSYIKMPAYQDGHAGYSNPLDEQQGVVALINTIEQSPEWPSTAIIVTYDDSDGWYDHQYATPTSASYSSADQLNGWGNCASANGRPLGVEGRQVDGRCGPGTRIPFLVISPWARNDYVDHTRITQASVVKFIEDNWLGGERIKGGSFDDSAGSINSLFDFDSSHHLPALDFPLDPVTGEWAKPSWLNSFPQTEPAWVEPLVAQWKYTGLPPLSHFVTALPSQSQWPNWLPPVQVWPRWFTNVFVNN